MGSIFSKQTRRRNPEWFVGFTLPSSKKIVNMYALIRTRPWPQKEKRPPPLVIMYTVVNSVQILKLITEVNRVCVMIVWAVNIQTQKVRVTYHLCFRVIHLRFFLNPFDGVETYQEKINRLCVINQHSNNTGQVGDAIKHFVLHCWPTKKKKIEKIYLVMTNISSIN